mmetsp:Transcript_103081/g.204677  ORF Transcript_103081/g.204677 Transcript_103081/m.204677 type:complete len:131 (-) Transcript_103081:871-1263(-)
MQSRSFHTTVLVPLPVSSLASSRTVAQPPAPSTLQETSNAALCTRAHCPKCFRELCMTWPGAMLWKKFTKFLILRVLRSPTVMHKATDPSPKTMKHWSCCSSRPQSGYSSTGSEDCTNQSTIREHIRTLG